jgi:hypothetical protein
MTLAERAEIKSAIRFYERRGWDWSDIVEYMAVRYNAKQYTTMVVHPDPGRRVKRINWKGRPRKLREKEED